MKFFKLRSSLDNKIVGKLPQVEKAVYHCDIWNEPKFIDRVTFQKVDFEPIVANAILKDSAKATDLIEATIVGFSSKLLISTKLKSIFEAYRTEGYQLFRSPIIKRGKELDDYWVLNPYRFDNHFIDFSKAVVVLKKRASDYDSSYQVVYEQISIEDFGEFERQLQFQKASDQYSHLFVKSFAIKSECKEDFLFLNNLFGGGMFVVSDRLKEAIEDVGCTGIEFQPTDLTLDEWLAPGGYREVRYGPS